MPFLLVAFWIGVGLTTLEASLVVLALSAVIQIGLAIGISAIQKALAPKAGLRGSSLQVSLSASDPRRGFIGRSATAGALVTFQTWGENNKWIVLIFRVADHKCTALNSVYWQGNPVTVGIGGAVSQFNTDGADHCWITFMDGTWNQAADADLIANSGGRWTSADKGQGIAYIKIKALADNKAFPGGINDLFQFLFVIDGAPFYDRRLDSSVGGSGSQRWNDQSTWALSANATLVTENFLRGFRAEDTTTAVGSRTVDYFMGLQLPDNVLPFAENVTAMNHCDESVSLKAGGSEVRYKLGGVITADQTGDTILSDLLAAQAGKLLIGAGRYVLLPGVTQTAVRSFTDADLRLDGPFTYTQDIALDTIANAVVGQFLDPSAIYSAQPLPPRTSSSDEAEDGGYKPDTLDLSYVTSQTQGQRVQEIHRRRSRRQKSATLCLAPENLDLEAGDWITWTSARLGWTTTFEILQVQPTGSDREEDLLKVTLSLQEVDSGVFAWTPASDELDYAVPTNLSSADPTAVNVASLTAAVTTITSGSLVLPALQITRAAVTDTTVSGITFSYWPHGSPSLAQTQTYPVTPATESGTQTTIITAGIVGGVQYDVEAAFITIPASDLAWSATVTTSGSTVAAVAGSTTGVLSATNRARFSEFEGGFGNGWAAVFGSGISSGASGLNLAIGLAAGYVSGTASASGKVLAMQGQSGQAFTVTAGERVAASVLLGLSGSIGAWTAQLAFLDVTGAALTSQTFASGSGTVSFPTAKQGFVTAPAGATACYVVVTATSSASGAMTIEIGQAMVASASASQTAFPFFSPGPNSLGGSTANPVFIQPDDPTTWQFVAGVYTAGTYTVPDGAFWDDTTNQVSKKRDSGVWVAAPIAVGPGTTYILTGLGSSIFAYPAGSYTHADIFLVGQGGTGFFSGSGKGATYHGGGGGEEREKTGQAVTAGSSTLPYTLSNSAASTTSTLVAMTANKGANATSSASGAGGSGGSGGTTGHVGRAGGLTNTWDGGAAWNPQTGAYNPDQTSLGSVGNTPGCGGAATTGAGPMLIIILRA